MDKGGLLPLLPDERDLVLGAVFDLPELSELPESFVIETLSIKDQVADRNDDFCASCAGAVVKEVQEGNVLFYPYLFAAAKFESGDDPDSWGLSLRDIGQAMRKWGCPFESQVPDEIRNLNETEKRKFENYPDWLRILAKGQAAKSYFFVQGKYDAFDDFKVALWAFKNEKRLGIMGTIFGWPLYQYELTGFPQGFGHALAVIGFEKDWLIVQNSAGSSAGMNGRHRISRETFNKYADTYGVMMFIDLPDHLDREEASKMSDSFKKGKLFLKAKRTYKTLLQTLLDLIKKLYE